MDVLNTVNSACTVAQLLDQHTGGIQAKHQGIVRLFIPEHLHVPSLTDVLSYNKQFYLRQTNNDVFTFTQPRDLLMSQSLLLNINESKWRSI